MDQGVYIMLPGCVHVYHWGEYEPRVKQHVRLAALEATGQQPGPGSTDAAAATDDEQDATIGAI